MVTWSDIYTDGGRVRKKYRMPRQARGVAIIDPAKVEALADEIRIIPAFMRAASKQAALETVEEFKKGINGYGIEPRFSARPESAPYNFSRRRRRSNSPPYVSSGDTRDILLARKPKMMWSGAQNSKLTAKLSIWGGNMNRLKGRGIRNAVDGYVLDSYVYTRKNGTVVTVKSRRRKSRAVSFTVASMDYKQEWAYTLAERSVLTAAFRKRLTAALRATALKQFTKTGKIKKSVSARIERGGV